MMGSARRVKTPLNSVIGSMLFDLRRSRNSLSAEVKFVPLSLIITSGLPRLATILENALRKIAVFKEKATSK